MSNVDSQASAAGGIIIQVLGEMSNDGGAWRKFAQTFFLAEQPNGYFVLNDIFRYLKEDGEVEEEAIDVDEALTNEIQEAEAKGEMVTHQIELKPQAVPGDMAAIQTAPSQKAITAQTAIEDTNETAPLSRLEDAQANGIIKQQEPTPAEPGEVGISKKVTTVESVDVPATKGATEAVEAETAQANPAAPTPALNGNTNAAPAPPSAPKTWANLAASNATKWGSTVSAESKGVSAARENASASGSKPINGVSTGSQQQSQANQGFKRQDGPGSVFIKNVIVEQMPSQGLQAALEAQFGPMKECQVIPSKACAFGEFATVEGARKAIQLSLPVAQGGEGGVKVGNNGWTVTVEEKRRPSDRPQVGGAPRGGGRGGGAGGAGGSPMNRGGGRGGIRGGTPARGGRAA